MPKTYNDIYFAVRTKLRDCGVEAYGLEARTLLAAAAGKTTEELLRDLYLYTSKEIEVKAEEMLERRLKGEPLAYIAGSWEFYGLPFTVTPDVLIPRMDTEVLVACAVKAVKAFGMKGRVLDLCCGSGCIACAVASELPAARVVAADISLPALDIARKNIKDNKLASRIITIHADARTWPPMSIGTFDIIASNPPYIASEEILTLDCSVRDHEPLGALDGGEDGLDFYRAIIRNVRPALNPGGWLCFEFGMGQESAVCSLLEQGGFTVTETRRDTADIIRAVLAQKREDS